MSLREKAAKGSVWLTVGGVLANGASFIRNMVLARLLTKADFGIGATFSLVITLLEFSAKLGMARLVVQDKDGDEPDFVSAAHLVQFCVAAVSAVMIVATAPLLARIFGVPGQGPLFSALALLAVVRGLQHVDVRRYERTLRFGPSTLVETIPQIAITVAAWPVARYFGDFRAILVLLLTKEAASCLVSHLTAERPYRWRWRRDFVIRMLRFGWPMLVTGFLMFGALQGDQFLVASFYSMTDLGSYAAAASLTMIPAFFFGRVFNSVALPVLARVQNDPVGLQRYYRKIVAVVVAFSASSTVALVTGAEALMRIIYGQKYAGGGIILVWLAAANAFRNLRMAPSLAALARGDSQNQLISNLWRVLSLIPAFALALAHKPVWCLACCGLFGEALAGWASLLRLKRRDGIPFSATLIPARWLTILIAGAAFATRRDAHRSSILLTLLSAAGCAVLAAAIVIRALPELRHEAGSAWKGFRLGGWREALSKILGHSAARKAPAL